MTAPAYLPSKGVITVKIIGKRQVWVPTHCAKAILIHRGEHYEAMAWLVPNVADPSHQFDTYRLSTDELEERLGLDFWAHLSDDVETQIEARR